MRSIVTPLFTVDSRPSLFCTLAYFAPLREIAPSDSILDRAETLRPQSGLTFFDRKGHSKRRAFPHFTFNSDNAA
jgi:hypothetical protein